MKLYTYAGNVHALQTLIAARYNGVEIELPAFEMGGARVLKGGHGSPARHP